LEIFYHIFTVSYVGEVGGLSVNEGRNNLNLNCKGKKKTHLTTTDDYEAKESADLQ